MIQDNPRKIAYLIAMKLLHSAYYSKSSINTLPDPNTALLNESGIRKTKVHQTILANKLPQFPTSNVVQEWPSPFFS